VEDLGVDGRIILNLIQKNSDLRTWNGLVWLRIETNGGLSWSQ